MRIGGLDQWIHVRGEHTKNPVLLFLHGGPGAALIGVAGRFQAPWEKHFTIVQWDQRGAGKTYARNDRELQRRTMTVRQMQQDTLDMANYLRRRFEREKIVVLGASWGGVPGLWLAHEHPDVVAAYVGVGQAVDLGLNTKTAYEDALAVARTRGLNDAVHELEALRPYPDPANLRKASAAQEWQAELLGPPADRPRFLNIPRLLSTLLTAPEYASRRVRVGARPDLFARTAGAGSEHTESDDARISLPRARVLLPRPFRSLHSADADRGVRPHRHRSSSRARVVRARRPFPVLQEQQLFADELLRRVRPVVDAF